MKSRNCILQRLPAVLLLPAAMAASLSLVAAPQEQPAKVEPPRSVFLIPNSPNEGRDPFFPQTTRRLSGNSEAAVTNAPAAVETGLLTLKSIIGGLAIINNHSFSLGEEGDVLTTTGERQHIRLVEINSKTRSVVVAIGGQNLELTLHDGI
jgi:hypothetical protein